MVRDTAETLPRCILLFSSACHVGKRSSRAIPGGADHPPFCVTASRLAIDCENAVDSGHGALPGAGLAMVCAGAACESTIRTRIYLRTQPGSLWLKYVSTQAAVLVLPSGVDGRIVAMARLCNRRFC